MSKSQTSVNLNEVEFFTCLNYDEKEEILILMRELVNHREKTGRSFINGQNK